MPIREDLSKQEDRDQELKRGVHILNDPNRREIQSLRSVRE